MSARTHERGHTHVAVAARLIQETNATNVRRDLLTRHERVIHTNTLAPENCSPSDADTASATPSSIQNDGHHDSDQNLDRDAPLGFQSSPRRNRDSGRDPVASSPAIAARYMLSPVLENGDTAEISRHQHHRAEQEKTTASSFPQLSATNGDSRHPTNLEMFTNLTDNFDTYDASQFLSSGLHTQPIQQTSAGRRRQRDQQEQHPHLGPYDHSIPSPPSDPQLANTLMEVNQPNMVSQLDFEFPFDFLSDTRVDETIDRPVLEAPDATNDTHCPTSDDIRFPLPTDTAGRVCPDIGRSCSDNNVGHIGLASGDLLQNLPIFHEESAPSLQSLLIDDTVHCLLRKDLADRLRHPLTVEELPSAKICDGFLASYVECFHPHLPIIHMPTLDLSTAASPLILTLCSIGALYRLDRRRSQFLYDLAIRSMQSIDQTPPDDLFGGYALWSVQTRLLLALYATLRGDEVLLPASMSENGFLTLDSANYRGKQVYTKTRTLLSKDKSKTLGLTWMDWIKRESWKRLLGGMYMLSTFKMVLYGVNPVFGQRQDLELEVIHDETLWNASSAEEWGKLSPKHTIIEGLMIKDVLDDVLRDQMRKYRRAPYRISGFTALYVMHAIVVQISQMAEVACTFAGYDLGMMPPLRAEHTLASALLDSTLSALSRCREFMARSRSDERGGAYDKTETSLASNCRAAFRIASTRLVRVTTGFERLNLVASDRVGLDRSILMYAYAKQERSSYMLQAVQESLEGIRASVKMGHMLIRKTAAFRWGIVHAIAAWDCALFVTKWAHLVEIDALNNIGPSADEQALLMQIRDLLTEADYDMEDRNSLAAGLARTWAWLLQDADLKQLPSAAELRKSVGVPDVAPMSGVYRL
ncbi:putative C2H2-type domain-containing protein [Seiridium cardinale]